MQAQSRLASLTSLRSLAYRRLMDDSPGKRERLTPRELPGGAKYAAHAFDFRSQNVTRVWSLALVSVRGINTNRHSSPSPPAPPRGLRHSISFKAICIAFNSGELNSHSWPT